MKLVLRNGFLQGTIFSLSFLMLTLLNVAESDSSLQSINLSNALTPHSRVKRDHGSCVNGMSLDGAASAGSASTLNAEANSGGGRGRGKRSVESVEPNKNETEVVKTKRSPPPPEKPQPLRKLLATLLKPRPSRLSRKSMKKPKRGWFATRTQALFARINHNPGFAQSFLDSESVQSDEYLSSRIMVNPRGVNCHDLCSPQNTRYALVGFCTPDYCQCFNEEVWDEHSWESSAGQGWDEKDLTGHEKERSCNKKKVFDPVKLKCADPKKTILCSDRPSFSGWSEKFSGWQEEY